MSDVEWYLRRKPGTGEWMFGRWSCGEPGEPGVYECDTLEDENRERKVDRETAADAGRYRLSYEYSPRFRMKLLTINGLPRHTGVRVHSLTNDRQTEGCVGVGNRVDEAKGEIYGGLTAGVRARLEQLFLEEEARGNTVWLNIQNAPGDRYVDTGNLLPHTWA